jgi:hypothetical protein
VDPEHELRLEEDDRLESRWHHVAVTKDYKCQLCGDYPSYDERWIYFETGWCAAHGRHLLKERFESEQQSGRRKSKRR